MDTGTVYPCHVQVQLHGPNNSLLCDVDKCCELGLAAGRGGQNFVCPHVQAALNEPNRVDEELPFDPVAMKVSSVMQESLVKLQAVAEEQRAPLIVKWPHDTECLHFSIFTGK
ncbi:hypothetical protein CAPTEDRAFT_205498, partial [Capitella teleta]